MPRRYLLFTAPRQVQVCAGEIPIPGAGQVLVQTLLSAISPGTEGLIYRGQFPESVSVDESIPALSGEFGYPLQYGYCLVGRVTALGEGVDPGWENRQVFAFHPHESHFLAEPGELIPLPEKIAPEDAVFLPNMETAVNFVMDGAPLIGERVAIFGQGIVGLLTTALLSRFPLSRLVSLDLYERRRQASLEAGAGHSVDPAGPNAQQELLRVLGGEADLTYELSGAPSALNSAINVTGFAGRVMIGSWYGQKRAELDLGGHFHRSRIRLVSSQVSSLAPELSGRWSKERRFDLAWDMIRQVRPSRWITHSLPFSEAEAGYILLNERPDQAIQVVFNYNT